MAELAFALFFSAFAFIFFLDMIGVIENDSHFWAAIWMVVNAVMAVAMWNVVL